MSGEIDLYGEVNLGIWSDTATIKIAGWDGFHQEIPIFTPIQSSWPIHAIAYRLFGQTNPKDVPQ